MKSSPVLLLIFFAIFGSAALAQGEAGLTFDFRRGASDNSASAGSQRVRSVATNRPAGNKTAVWSAQGLEREVFKLLNAQRREHGLSELDWNDDVAALARMHSENMADQDFFSHRGSDGSMVDDRADRLGLGSWMAIGENIAFIRGYENPALLALQKWMESTSHRKNLLGSNWKESAVGVAVRKDGTYYLTQVFLRRK